MSGFFDRWKRGEPARRLLKEADSQVQGAVEALDAVLPLLHGDVLDSNAIAEMEVDVRAALYRLGQVASDDKELRSSDG